MSGDALRRLAVLVLALVAAACAAGESDPAADDPVPTWPTELELRIGALDDPIYSLTAVRGMEIGPDGSIYTLHPTEAIIRQFDAAGSLVRTIGGRGGGPGEFQRPRAMGMVGDTLWVLDSDGYRVSQFGLGGDFLGSFQVPFDMGGTDLSALPPRAEGLLFDGTVHGAPPGPASALADGSLREVRPVLMSRTGEVTLALPSVPYSNLVWDISIPGTGGGSYRPQPYADSPIHTYSLTELALLVVDRAAPHTAEDAMYRVIKLGFGGDTLFERRFRFDPLPIDEVALDSLLDRFAESSAQSRLFSIAEGEARRLAESTLYRPAYRPGVRHLIPGRDGSVAIGLEPGDAEMAIWLFLDSDGEPVGRATLPSNVLIRQIELPLLWGVETDDLDVPYVVRYRVATSMIAGADESVGATLARAVVVPSPRSQASRKRGGPPIGRIEAS
jgi:hypothetical protein